MVKQENVFNDLVNSALSEVYKEEQKKITKEQNITIKCIKKRLGRRYAKQAIRKTDGVYVGPYKFIGESVFVNGSLCNTYNLYYVDDSGKEFLINNLVDFGNCIISKNKEN